LSGYYSTHADAAEIDGLGRFGAFFRIVLPLARPALAAQIIFVFMASWNDFMKPLIVMSSPEMFTLPILVIYAFFNRYFIKGITFTDGK
jgi:multiple sugar transport system permease protein